MGSEIPGAYSSESAAFMQTVNGLVPVRETGSGELVVVMPPLAVDGEPVPTGLPRNRSRRTMGIFVRIIPDPSQSFPELNGLAQRESMRGSDVMEGFSND